MKTIRILSYLFLLLITMFSCLVVVLIAIGYPNS